MGLALTSWLQIIRMLQLKNGIIVSNENNHFVIDNCRFNSIIQPSETITIGFIGKHLDDQICPSNSVLHNFAYEPIEAQDMYTVTFDCSAMEVINAPAEQMVLANGLVEEPIAPSRVGYSFGGWYADELYTIRYNFSAPVTDNLTLHAKWQWTIGEDVETGRDMANPTLYNFEDRGGVHIVGEVVNKAAYLMMTDDRTSGITSKT